MKRRKSGKMVGPINNFWKVLYCKELSGTSKRENCKVSSETEVVTASCILVELLVPSSSCPDRAIVWVIDQNCDFIQTFITKSKPRLQLRSEKQSSHQERTTWKYKSQIEIKANWKQTKWKKFRSNNRNHKKND